jgi:hypothetical protein
MQSGAGRQFPAQNPSVPGCQKAATEEAEADAPDVSSRVLASLLGFAALVGLAGLR